MVPLGHVVVFRLDGQRYGLPLAVVERVIPAVAIVPLPQAPAVVLGVINLQGRIIPAVDVRARFGLASRELVPSDRFIIAKSPRRTLALVAEQVDGPARYDTAETAAAVPRTPYIAGVAALSDGVALIHDLDTFLSLEEETALSDAMAGAAEAPA